MVHCDESINHKSISMIVKSAKDFTHGCRNCCPRTGASFTIKINAVLSIAINLKLKKLINDGISNILSANRLT